MLDTVPWLAIWTKPRAEKAVARALDARRQICWLPTYARQHQWSDRLKIVELPLFPGYLFAQAGDDGWTALLRVPGILTIVKRGKEPAPISSGEIANLKAAITRLASLHEEPQVEPEFAPGELVRVADGPLAGLVGTVRERRGGRRLLVGFEQIGQSLSISLSAGTLERIDIPAADLAKR